MLLRFRSIMTLHNVTINTYASGIHSWNSVFLFGLHSVGSVSFRGSRHSMVPGVSLHFLFSLKLPYYTYILFMTSSGFVGRTTSLSFPFSFWLKVYLFVIPIFLKLPYYSYILFMAFSGFVGRTTSISFPFSFWL